MERNGKGGIREGGRERERTCEICHQIGTYYSSGRADPTPPLFSTFSSPLSILIAPMDAFLTLEEQKIHIFGNAP